MGQAGVFVYLLPVRRYRNPAGIDPSLQVGDLTVSAPVLLMATFGAFIVLRSADRLVGWLMLTGAFFVGVGSLAAEYSQYALLVAPQANLPLDRFAAWVQDLWTIPTALLPLQSNLFLSLVATGIIAVLFNPLRAILLSNVFNKLRVSDRAQAIVKAREAGLGGGPD